MNIVNFLSVCVGASLGALLRWWLGIVFNPIFPSIPIGTLTANIVGGFLMGIFMALTTKHLFFPEAVSLAVATGFLGGLTTFSTFSAETVTLMTHQEYFLSTTIILGHVVGSILATIFGMYTTKIFIS